MQKKPHGRSGTGRIPLARSSGRKSVEDATRRGGATWREVMELPWLRNAAHLICPVRSAREDEQLVLPGSSNRAFRR